MSENANIYAIALHYVGNQSNDEPFLLSPRLYGATAEMSELLTDYFLGAFKSEERYQFFDEMGLENNRVYRLVSDIFDNPDMVYQFSVDLATHLYENCQHPKIKGGYFYVVYFKNCSIGVGGCDAVGLFKIENQDQFLTIEHDDNGFDITSVEGINLKRLDKGCIVYNYEREKGYMVSVVDKTNSSGATYWVDSFLNLTRRQDAYFQTENLMTLCRNFLVEELPKEFDVCRADQVDMLNRSMNYFKNSPKFDKERFDQQVLNQPEVIERFDNYKGRYQDEREIHLEDSFDLNQTAVKRQGRAYKSVIKLDKNFHIYIHGNRELVERGEDEHGRFYKLYFNEES